jgi:hypothetical protein
MRIVTGSFQPFLVNWLLLKRFSTDEVRFSHHLSRRDGPSQVGKRVQLAKMCKVARLVELIDCLKQSFGENSHPRAQSLATQKSNKQTHLRPPANLPGGLASSRCLCRRAVSGGHIFHRAELAQDREHVEAVRSADDYPRSIFSRRNAKSRAVTAVPTDGIDAAS